MKPIRYIDIFAGCGGLSLGLCNSGFSGIFAVEKNRDAFSTLKYNLIDNTTHFDWPSWLPVKEYDINVLMKDYADKLKLLEGKVELVAGGPPCQGFSMAGERKSNDRRNELVKSYVKFIRIIKPEMIVFENVRGFTVKFTKKDGKQKKYSNYIINALKRAGYKTSYRIIDMSEFGIPQSRKRFILVAMKNHNPDKFFEILYRNREDFFKAKNITGCVYAEEAIDDLKKQHGTVDSPDSKNFKAGIYGPITSNYQKLMRSNNEIPINTAVDSHRFVNHSDEIIELHNDLLKNGIKGKRITPSDKLIKDLRRRGVTVLDKRKIVPTITSIPDELVHYEEPRILTVREHARIQSFPDWYQFKGKYTSGGQRRKVEAKKHYRKCKNSRNQ